jgi:hypothetical protein
MSKKRRSALWIPVRVVGSLFRVVYHIGRGIGYLFWSHPDPKKKPMLSKRVRWDLLEKGMSGEEAAQATVQPETAVRTGSTTTRLPEARGKMPPLSRRSSTQVEAAPPQSPEERSHKDSVRLTMNVGGRRKPAVETASMGSPVAQARQTTSEQTALFSRGQIVNVMLPEQNRTIEARIANIGASEIMFSIGAKEATDVTLEKGQPVVLLFAPREGVLHVFDAEVYGLKGKHSTWFTVAHDSMHLRGRRVHNRVTLNMPIRYCLVRDREEAMATSDSHCDISSPSTGVLSEVGEDWFSLLTESPLSVGACILQVPGTKSEMIENLKLSGEVIGVAPNTDPVTRRTYPFSATLRILTTSDKLTDLISMFQAP